MGQITIDKSYFEALLRRADCHANTDDNTPVEEITIKLEQYNALLCAARDFETLKQALYTGGVTKDTLNLLISGNQDESTCDQSDNDLTESEPLTSSRGYIAHDAPRRNFNNPANDVFFPRPRTRNLDRKPSTAISTQEDFDEHGSFETITASRHDSLEVEEVEEAVQRTLYFSNLPERTTYTDLLSVIRGGTLVGVNLRRAERAATATFLDGAADFLAWAKRNDIYLHSKRVEVKWADRQFQLNEHIRSKMNLGVTRNLLIGNAVARGLTAQQIRDDMEHIDKLVIIDVAFYNGNAYVGTNSVCNAMYARTCMLSRIAYKGCKVEFMPDECAGPLPRRETSRSLSAPQKLERKVSPLTNRFDLLNMDGGES